MNTFYKQQSFPGFTLVETLVSVAIFTFAIAMGTLVIVSMSHASKRVSVKDQAVQSAYYIMDSLTRSIRTGSDYIRTPAGGEFSEFSWKDQYGIQNQLRISGASPRGLEIKKENRDWMPLHDTEVLQIKNLDFVTNGEDKTDTVQSSVGMYIVFQYQYRGQSISLPVQTSLTQRTLDTDRFIPTIGNDASGGTAPGPNSPI
jgi:type II secretory pathway pseudopilin PulG